MSLDSPATAAADARPDAYAALRVAGFRRLLFGVLLFAVALLIQEVVIGYRLYQLTHDPLSLGLVGLAEAVPFISLALFGGHFADRHDKRRIIRLTMIVFIADSSALLWVLSASAQARLPQATQLLLIYALAALLGLARGFFTPAAGALLPFLVPRELYARASAWRSSSWQTGAVIGPAAGGFLYAGIGLSGTLATVLLLLLAALLSFSRIRLRDDAPPLPPAGSSIWHSLREGLTFVFRSRLILYAISLDLFSVLFGGVVAILPVFASDILRVGAQGLGLLRAAPSLGAMLTVIACTHYLPLRHAWRNLLLAVAGFGVATLAFALSKLFWVSLLALFATGVFDSVSVVIRQTIVQVLPPDHLRGRVYSVNSIFISSSNELGAFESGSMARLIGTVPSVLFGAAMTLVTALYCWCRGRDLFSVRLT
ncbi:MAG: MFS transporter [Gammaproteobacteria bacterium]|nr:MFS transporter [Gammaproteobacteria bacterium]